jgi:hypothetical protein
MVFGSKDNHGAFPRRSPVYVQIRKSWAMLHDFYGTMMVAAQFHQEADCRVHIGVNAFPLLQLISIHKALEPKQKRIALLDKVLDLLQPANVLLLLLDVDVLRNEHSEIGVDAPLVEVVLEESLQVLVELGEGRAGVHLLGGEGLVGDLGLGEVGGSQVSNGLDLEGAAVRHKVDAECAGVLLAGARNQDVDIGGESRVGVVLEE